MLYFDCQPAPVCLAEHLRGTSESEHNKKKIRPCRYGCSRAQSTRLLGVRRKAYGAATCTAGGSLLSDP